MKLLVNALGAWVAIRAAEGQYSRPAAIGIAMLVSRLGPGAIALTLAGYGLKRLDEAGAFDDFKQSRGSLRSAARGRLSRPEQEDAEGDDQSADDESAPARGAARASG